MAGLPKRYVFESNPIDQYYIRRREPTGASSDTVAEHLQNLLSNMLNSKALSDLLTKNVHPELFQRWFIMSPNATLLAYSKPSNVKDVRDQAALVSMVWKQHAAQAVTQNPQTEAETDLVHGQLETLTIEFSTGNIIVKAIQPRLLLVLVGGIAPGTESTRGLKITPERAGGMDEVYPPIPSKEPSIPDHKENAQSSEPANFSSSYSSQNAGSSRSFPIAIPGSILDEAKHGVLYLQRQKMEAAVAHLRADFQMKGFVMPEEPVVNV